MLTIKYDNLTPTGWGLAFHLDKLRKAILKLFGGVCSKDLMLTDRGHDLVCLLHDTQCQT